MGQRDYRHPRRAYSAVDAATDGGAPLHDDLCLWRFSASTAASNPSGW